MSAPNPSAKDAEDARIRLEKFLCEQLGDHLELRGVGPVEISYESSQTFADSYYFPLVTPEPERQDAAHHTPGVRGVIVPKGDQGPHWLPRETSIEEYIADNPSGLSSRPDVTSPIRVRYFGCVDGVNPNWGIISVIRRTEDGTSVVDEVYTRNLKWERTDMLLDWDFGRLDDDIVNITTVEALDFVGRVNRRPGAM